MPEFEKPVIHTENKVLPVRKNGSVLLPKTRLSLWAALLTLIGAVGLLGYVLIDPILFKTFQGTIKTPEGILQTLEALLLLTASVLLLTTRAGGKSLKASILVFAAGALLAMPLAINTYIQLMPQYDLFMMYFILLTKAFPLLAAIFAVLYVFKVIPKTPTLIGVGLLFGGVLALGGYMYIRILVNMLNTLPTFDVSFIKIGFALIYYILFPTGVFLTVLASKKKDA